RFRLSGPLPQPPPLASRDRGRGGGDLLGEPRPDAGAGGYPLDQLPAYARDLPPDQCPPSETDETDIGGGEYLARRGGGRECPDPRPARRRDRGGGSRRL